MNNLKKISYLLSCALFVTFVFSSTASSQDRPRIIKSTSSRPINQPPSPADTQDKTKSLSSSVPSNAPAARPTLTSQLVVPAENKEPLIKKTSMSMAMNAAAASLSAGRLAYSPVASNLLMQGIESRLGIPYRFGSTGPNRYDCSGFVWSVFTQAGINFERQNVRSLWSISQPVEGDERYKFGTLVFLNGLGHIGIVADANGFYHASSSKGVTYSPFAGYWEKRVVGFRRLPAAASRAAVIEAISAEK